MTTVGVVVPCFDLGEYLREAVDSVRAQTRRADALVVVDDGSTDEHTLAVLEKLRSDGVTVLRTENRGAPAARNHGIEHLDTDYVLCLDADDVLLPEFLANTLPVLDGRPEVAIVTTHVELFGEQDGLWETGGYDPARLLFENCLASASLFRRECWRDAGGYPELEACQDWALWLAIVARGGRWHVVPEPLYCYRVRAGSISDRAQPARAETLRRLVELHRPLYAERAGELVAAVDSELRSLRDRLATAERHASEQAQRADELQRRLREHETGLVYEQVVARVRSAAAELPEDATVLVVSRGDEQLVELGPRRALHFPDDGDTWAGYHPATGDDAVEHLEAMRERGAAFFVLPATELWWLEHYPELRDHLERHYPALLFDRETGAIFDVRERVTPRTFSVVICTYNRAALLPPAIESVLAQLYPKSSYELVVVDNGSTDATADAVRPYLDRDHVAVSYVVEPRNGLSYARNAGIARSRHEYVAFLDDDATASPIWLSAFNAVADRHGALVVGGRIDPVFEGFEPPAWVREQYVTGFFGLDYRTWKQRERIFRIRRPLYLGGGNSAYARRLFDHFGGFRTDLGRDATTLLAAEETQLNLELERHDVPIYYTDHAAVAHRIAPERLTRRHVWRKAWWAGVSDAIVEAGAAGDDARTLARRAVASAARELRRLARNRDETTLVAAMSRVLHDVGFVGKLGALTAARRLGRANDYPARSTWTLDESIREVAAWRDGPAKQKQLYNLYVAAGRDDDARAALAHLGEWVPAEQLPDPEQPLAPFGDAIPHMAYDALVERIRDVARASLPRASRVIVVSKGDPGLVQLDGHEAWHFPQDERGGYAGYYPADSAAAIAQLEQLRARGGEYLLLPTTASWWLEHYDGFAKHLQSRYPLIRDGEPCRIFDLGGAQR